MHHRAGTFAIVRTARPCHSARFGTRTCTRPIADHSASDGHHAEHELNGIEDMLLLDATEISSKLWKPTGSDMTSGTKRRG